LPNIQVSSKSGTAQTTDNGKKSNNSWIMSFAPYEAPKYAICVMVQNGGSGGGVCGPLVNLIYRGLFARDAGARLPIKPLTKVFGNTDRIEKTIDIPADVIAAVEAGDIEGAPKAIPMALSTKLPDNEESGETGEEAGETAPSVLPSPSAVTTPTPTITPEVDAEGSVIPRALPVPSP
jgi:penicillin-binding protein 2